MLHLPQIIEGCKNRDIKAQGELYKMFSGKLYGLCLKYSSNVEQAKDNLQDAFLTIFEKIDQYSYKGSFEGWIKRITINVILQKYRKETFLEIIKEPEQQEVEVEVCGNELSLNELLGFIQALPSRYRLTFNLYVLDNYSHKEIASMLNISIGTSKSNLARAKAILKDKIENKFKIKIKKSRS